LIWSAKELHGQGQYKNVYSPISLSVEFQVTRPATDVADWAGRANANHITRPRAATAFLCILSDSEITLEENKLSVIDVRLPAESVVQKIRSAGKFVDQESGQELGMGRRRN